MHAKITIPNAKSATCPTIWNSSTQLHINEKGKVIIRGRSLKNLVILSESELIKLFKSPFLYCLFVADEILKIFEYTIFCIAILTQLAALS